MAMAMADRFCRFLDFRSPTINYKLPIILPSNHSYSSALHSTRFSRISKRPYLSASSDFDVISTHEHSDGSILFRFGDPSEVAKNVKTGEPKTVKEEIEGEVEEKSRVVKYSILEKKADGEVDDLTNSVLSSSSIIAVVEGESESSENLLESSTDTDSPVLTSSGETEDVSTPNVDAEHIEEGLNEEYGDSSPVESSILDEGSIVEVESNTTTPEFLEKENAEEPSIIEPIIGVPDNGILQDSLGTDVSTDVSPISQHETVGTETQIETNEDGRESLEPAIILSKEIEEHNLPAEMQEVAMEEGSKTDINDIEALEMQSLMSNDNASDAYDAEAKSLIMEDEASVAGSGILEAAVEFLSEKDTIQLMTMPPRLEANSVLEEEIGVETVEESREGDGSENQEVGGYLVEPSVPEATVTESTPISKSDMNDIEDLEMQNVTGNGNASNTSTMEENASGAGRENVMAQLISMPPHLEADTILEVETSVVSVEESREDDGSKNLKVGGDLIESSVNEVIVTESIPISQEMLMKKFVLSSGAALLLHPTKALTGGEDAYFVSGQTWLGVADGVGLWSREGTNPGVYAQELMKICERLVKNGDSINNPVELLNLSVAETESPGSSTVLITQFDGQALHVANVGDSGFIVLRNGAIHMRSSPMNHAFRFPVQIKRGDDDPSSLAELYRVDVEENDVIITATDGLLDNLYDQEISLIVMKSLAAGKMLKEIAERLALKAQEIGRCASVRTPFGDNARAAGFSGYTGGKLDDVAVIVSIVQRR